MSKIVFFSESNYNGKSNQQMIGRTDTNWIYALDATHICINNIDNVIEQFDIGVVIIPKKFNSSSNIKLHKLKSICKYVGMMQEANHTYWQDYDVPTQIKYYQLLDNLDFILCHNNIDKLYYSGLFPNKKVFINPTLMLTDNIKNLPTYTRKNVIIGGTLCKWYGGFDSYIIANNFKCDIYAPAMGRISDFERNQLSGIKYIDYQNWSDWMNELSKFKYAVHLMRTYAAGSFQLNCAYLKVPCLGWEGTDTQQKLFPELTFKEGDMLNMTKTAKHLHTNELFYNYVVEYAYKQYEEQYKLDKFLNHWEEIKNEIQI